MQPSSSTEFTEVMLTPVHRRNDHFAAPCIAAAAGHVVQLVVGQLAGLVVQPVKVHLGLLLGQLNTVLLCQRQQLLGRLCRLCPAGGKERPLVL